jgi:hypothetical protein
MLIFNKYRNIIFKKLIHSFCMLFPNKSIFFVAKLILDLRKSANALIISMLSL